MATVLTIRNLTTLPTELRIVERAAGLPIGPQQNLTIAHVTQNFTSLFSNSTAQVTSVNQHFIAQDVSIPLAAFETKQTDIAVKPNETLRLTFETLGQRYQVDTPCLSDRSQVLKPLSPDAKEEYTAVYLPTHAFLALYSSSNLSSWMGALKDSTSLSALSIPGTHNSPTYRKALPSVRCQVASVKDQLENGVRFLDIRLSPQHPDDLSKDAIALVHSAFPVALTGNKYFVDLVAELTDFLTAHPTETILVSLKREGVIKCTDQQLGKILHAHYINDAHPTWYTHPTLPTLAAVRGKLVLIRRFALDDSLRPENNGLGWGIDASTWPDNCADGLCTSGAVRVQDFYEVEETVNISKKITYAEAQLARAAANISPVPTDESAASIAAASVEAAKQPLFINFLSASNFFHPGCWPDRIAARVNPHIVDFLCRKHNQVGTVVPGVDAEGLESVAGAAVQIGDGGTGVVVCDWVGEKGDWDLVRCIVGHNARLVVRADRAGK